MSAPTDALAVEYSPRLHLDLDKKVVKQLAGITPGAKVKMIVNGSLESITMTDDDEYAGSLCIEISKVRIAAMENAVAELVYDDDEPGMGDM